MEIDAQRIGYNFAELPKCRMELAKARKPLGR